jgi:hypothetical protein
VDGAPMTANASSLTHARTPGRGRLWAVITVVIVAVALLALVAARPAPRAASLPPNAEALGLAVQPAPLWTLPFGGCPTALIQPVRVARDANSLVFLATDDGTRRQLVWPAGFSARVVVGHAQLVTPNGSVYASEGDVLTSLIGAAADNGDMLVCFASSAEYDR